MLVEFTECEIVHDKIQERSVCFINPEHIVYIEDAEEFDGYCFIGLVGSNPTIVKGTAKEVLKKIKGKSWLKTLLHL